MGVAESAEGAYGHVLRATAEEARGASQPQVGQKRAREDSGDDEHHAEGGAGAAGHGRRSQALYLAKRARKAGKGGRPPADVVAAGSRDGVRARADQRDRRLRPAVLRRHGRPAVLRRHGRPAALCRRTTKLCRRRRRRRRRSLRPWCHHCYCLFADQRPTREHPSRPQTPPRLEQWNLRRFDEARRAGVAPSYVRGHYHRSACVRRLRVAVAHLHNPYKETNVPPVPPNPAPPPRHTQPSHRLQFP
jgi:hypothetical protein